MIRPSLIYPPIRRSPQPGPVPSTLATDRGRREARRSAETNLQGGDQPTVAQEHLMSRLDWIYLTVTCSEVVKEKVTVWEAGMRITVSAVPAARAVPATAPAAAPPKA
jgi:hypothetical protein